MTAPPIRQPLFATLAPATALALALTLTTPPVLAQALPPAATIQQVDPAADRLASDMRRLAENPRDLEALVSAGRGALGMGDPNGALGFFLRAQAVAPGDGRSKAGMASALIELERPAEALRLFDEATRMGIRDVDIAADRGLAYDLVGDTGRAQRDYALALTRARDDETVRRYALSLGIAGRRDEALALLDPLLRRQDRGAWRARAFVLAMAGDVNGAQAVARQTLPAGMAQMLQPYFTRLGGIRSPGARAFAVHYGQLGGNAATLARRAAPAPTGPAVAPPPPVALAAVTPARAGGGANAARERPTTPAAARRASERPARTERTASLRPELGRVTERRSGRSARRQSRGFNTAPVSSDGDGLAEATRRRLRERDARQTRVAERPATPSVSLPATGAGTPAPVQRTTTLAANTPLRAARPAADSAPGFTAPSSLLSAAPTEPVRLAAAPSPSPARASMPNGSASGSPSTAVSTMPLVPATSPVLSSAAPTVVPVAPVISSPTVAPPPSPAAATINPAASPSAGPSPSSLSAAPIATGEPTSPPTGRDATGPVVATGAPPAPAGATSGMAAPATLPVAAPPSTPPTPLPPPSSSPTAIAGPPAPDGRPPAVIAQPAVAVAAPTGAAPTPGFVTTAPAASPVAIGLPPSSVASPSADTPAQRTALLASIIAGIEIPGSELAARPAADAAEVRRVAEAAAARRREVAAREKAEAAEARRRADAEAARKAAEAAAKAAPERHWVQIATGASADQLGRDFRRMVAKAPVLKGQQGWSARFGATRRMLVGPFATERAAIQFMQRAKAAGVEGFNWTSPEGTDVEKLPGA